MKVINYLLATVLLAGVFNDPVFCTEQSEETPALRGVIEPTASSPSVSQGERQSAGRGSEVTETAGVSNTADDNQSDGQSKSETDTFKTQASKALKGGVTQTEINEAQDSLSGHAEREIAAIGISWNLFNHVINYVDPGSDLYGKVEPGKDRFLGLGELDAVEVVRSGYNIGDSGTWVDAVIRGRDHVIRHIPVRRQPISSFAPKFAHRFARQYKLRN